MLNIVPNSNSQDSKESAESKKTNFKNSKITRHLRHDRFYAKIDDLSHRVAYTMHRISYTYCIGLDKNVKYRGFNTIHIGRGRSYIVAYYSHEFANFLFPREF